MQGEQLIVANLSTQTTWGKTGCRVEKSLETLQ